MGVVNPSINLRRHHHYESRQDHYYQHQHNSATPKVPLPLPLSLSLSLSLTLLVPLPLPLLVPLPLLLPMPLPLPLVSLANPDCNFRCHNNHLGSRLNRQTIHISWTPSRFSTLFLQSFISLIRNSPFQRMLRDARHLFPHTFC